jgi:hypothetical protein
MTLILLISRSVVDMTEKSRVGYDIWWVKCDVGHLLGQGKQGIHFIININREVIKPKLDL